MKFERNEVYTGLLVVVSLGVLIGVILLLSVPGLFKPLKHYAIFFDNAAGLKPGAPVLVAGRKIGNVSEIASPIPRAKRPVQYPEDEVLITVDIDRREFVYANATARMQQDGLLGQQVIDFVGGTEESGSAQNGAQFIGVRVPDLNSALPKILAVIEPVASTATLTLSELRQTIEGLNSVFGQQGDLQGALTKLRLTADNLSGLTSQDGALTHSLTNLQSITGKLQDENGPLMGTLNNLKKTTSDINEDGRVQKILTNFQDASAKATLALRNVNQLVSQLSPGVVTTVHNLTQMTDTLKRQPWRIIWPSTKKYNGPAEPDWQPGVASSPTSAHERRSLEYGRDAALARDH